MKDITLETLGERKVKVESEHIAGLRQFWKSTLGQEYTESGINQKLAINNLGVSLNPNLSNKFNIANQKQFNQEIELNSELTNYNPEPETNKQEDNQVPENDNVKEIEAPIASYEDFEESKENEPISFEMPSFTNFEATVPEPTKNEEAERVEEDMVKKEEPKYEEVPFSNFEPKQEDNTHVNYDEPRFINESNMDELNNTSDIDPISEFDDSNYISENHAVGLESAYDEIKKSISRLQDAMDTYKTQAEDQLQSDKNEIRRQGDNIIALTQDLRAEEARNHVLQDDNDELVRINRKLNSSLDIVRAEKVSAENKVTELGGVIGERDDLITSLQRELARLRAKLEIADKDAKTAKTTKLKLNEEIRRLKNDNNNKDEQIASLKRELEKSKNQNTRLENQIKGFTSGVVEALDGLNDKQEKKTSKDKKKMKLVKPQTNNTYTEPKSSDEIVNAFAGLETPTEAKGRRR